MKSTYASQRLKSKHSKQTTIRLRCDAKPLVKIALKKEKSKEFCSKTAFLATKSNSRYQKLKIQFNDLYNKNNINHFIKDSIERKVYLHPVCRQLLGRYLKIKDNVDSELRKQVV